jgi:phage shock protein PspC (stress-responsive transcriptional regulator)
VSLADELTRLEELRTRGTLSDDEFQRAKARLLDPPPAGTASSDAVAAVQRFRRSRSDRWIGGVCGGVAAITGIDAWVWRLMVTVLFLFGGTGALLYILLWIFVPNE